MEISLMRRTREPLLSRSISLASHVRLNMTT